MATRYVDRVVEDSQGIVHVVSWKSFQRLMSSHRRKDIHKLQLKHSVQQTDREGMNKGEKYRQRKRHYQSILDSM